MHERATAPRVIGLAGFSPHGDDLELGDAIRADHWGQGYATEAVSAALGAAKALDRSVYATIRSTNARSLSVAGKVGLVHRGETIEDERGSKLVFRSP